MRRATWRKRHKEDKNQNEKEDQKQKKTREDQIIKEGMKKVEVKEKAKDEKDKMD